MLMLQKKYTAVRFGLSLSLMLLSLTAQSAEPYRLELHGGYSSLTSDDSAYGTVLDPTLGAFAQTSVARHRAMASLSRDSITSIPSRRAVDP